MHLKKTYGFINSKQLADNYNKMTAQINFQDPIETLFKNIEDGMRYANAVMQLYMEAQCVNIYFLLILNTGSITDVRRDWQRRTPVNQKWDDFRCEFARSEREQHIIYSTTSRAGYHTANVAEHYVQNQLTADGGFKTSMANLATATSDDRETVAFLTKAIKTLADQLAAKYMWAKSQEAELKLFLDGRATTAPIVTAASGAACEEILQNQERQLLLVIWVSGWISSHKCQLHQKSSWTLGCSHQGKCNGR
jgi:hypothetical protein